MKKCLITVLFCILSCSCLLAEFWEPCCLVNNKDPDDRFVFIFIPKNGSSTFRIVVNTLHLVPYDHSRFKNSTKILIVRDPIYRPISIYSEVMKLRHEKNRTISEEFYKNRENIAESFKQFLLAIRNDFYEPHITTQCSFLDVKELTLDDIDFVLLFENLDEDMRIFCDLNDITYHNYTENVASTYMKEVLKELIISDEEIRNLIYTIWEKDFEFYEDARKRRSEIFKGL
jgi:hypothetical protein